MISSNKLFGERQIKAVILISDGQLNVGDAPQIIRYVNRNNLVVHTIAIGTEEGGQMGFDTVSKVDEDFLKALSFNSNGEFFRAIDIKDLEDSFSTLIRETNREVVIDLTFYLLLISIIIFSVLWILYNLRFKVVP